MLPGKTNASYKHIAMHICKANIKAEVCDYQVCHKTKRTAKDKERCLAYLRSLCFGLGREYFRYPSQGTFLRPARTDIMSLTLHKCIGIEPNKFIIRNFTKHMSM